MMLTKMERKEAEHYKLESNIFHNIYGLDNGYIQHSYNINFNFAAFNWDFEIKDKCPFKTIPI